MVWFGALNVLRSAVLTIDKAGVWSPFTVASSGSDVVEPLLALAILVTDPASTSA